MTEIIIISECWKGNRSAFKELYQLLSPPMMIICRRYMGGSPFLKDVFQEAFIKICGSLDRFPAVVRCNDRLLSLQNAVTGKSRFFKRRTSE